MEQGVIGAVVAAIITSIVVSWVNFKTQTNQHEHAYDIQRQQWSKEAGWRREDRQAEREQQQAAWDNARADQDRERDRDIMVQLQIELPRFSRASRVLFENNLAIESFHDDPKNAGKSFTPDPKDLPFEEEFSAMRMPVLATISRIRNDTLRQAALNLYDLNVAMAVGEVSLWDNPAHWGGNPIFQQVDRESQVIGMAGRSIRGERIYEDELIPIVHERGAFGRHVREQEQRSRERRALRQASRRD